MARRKHELEDSQASALDLAADVQTPERLEVVFQQLKKRKVERVLPLNRLNAA